MDITNMFEDSYTVSDFLDMINRDWDFVIIDRSGEVIFEGNVWSYMNGEYDKYDDDDEFIDDGYDDYGDPEAIGYLEFDEAVIERISIDDNIVTLNIAL